MPYVSPNSTSYVATLAKSDWHNYQVSQSLTYPRNLFYNISNRVYSVDVKRGRNYELGRAESGEAQLRIDNADGLLTATNTASPLYGYIKPYKPISINALHNGTATPTTGNLINDTNTAQYSWTSAPAFSTYVAEPVSVSANDGNAETSTTNNWFTVLAGTPTTIGTITRQSVNKWQGTYAWEYTAVGNRYVLLDVPVIAGQTYNFSAYTTRSTNTITMNVWDGVWYEGKTASATTTLTTSTTTFTRTSLSWTASSPRATIGYYVPNGVTLRIDGVQVEFGNSASTYTTTGPTIHPLFNGFVERYPQSWEAPNRAESKLIATDSLASMSQMTMDNLYLANTLLFNPSYYYPLDADADSIYTTNQSAYNQSALIAGTNTADHAGTGSAGTLTFGVETSKVSIPAANTTCVSFADGVASSKTLTATGFNFSDLSFNPSAGSTDIIYKTYEIWFTPDFTGGGGHQLFSIVRTDGVVSVGAISAGTDLIVTASGASGSVSNTHTGLISGRWYHLMFTVQFEPVTNSTRITSRINGGSSLTNIATVDMRGDIYDIELGFAFTGSLAHFAVYPSNLITYANDRYSMGATAYSGLALSTQFAYLFTVAGFSYPILSVENSISYGTTMNWLSGQSLFDNAQTIVDSEAGTWAVAGSGEIVFHNRRYRQNKFNASVSFADDNSANAFQASEVVVNYDPTFVINDITINRVGGVNAKAFNSESVVAYFPRTYDRTIYNTSDLEAIDCAFYLLDRYEQPQTRIESILLTPARNTAIWQVALGLELDDLIGVIKEQNVDATSVPISSNYFVERIEHSIDGTTGEWNVRAYLSPQLTKYNQLDALDTTTTASTIVGATSVTVSRQSSKYSINDLVIGGMFTIDAGNSALREDFVLSGTPTQTSTTITMPLTKITNRGVYLTSTAYPDGTSVTFSPTGVFPTSGTVLVGTEIFDFFTPVTGVWSISNRAQFGTQPQTLWAGQEAFLISGGFTSAHSNGANVFELLPSTNTDGVFYNNALATNLYTITGDKTTTTPASGLAYSSLPFAQMIDYNNVPASDITVGQIATLVNTTSQTELVGFTYVSNADSTGAWFGVFYPFAGNRLLSADLTIDATTVTTSVAVPVGTRAIMIDNEWMTVTAGAGTTSLTVVRGTADSAIWDLSNIAPHYSNNTTNKVYYVTTLTGLANSYANGGTARVESASVSNDLKLAY